MHMHEQPQPQDRPQRYGWLQSRKTTWILLGFLAVGAFFLLTEHTAHLLGILPFLIFLMCPLMMLLMHGGMADRGVMMDMRCPMTSPRGEDSNEY